MEKQKIQNSQEKIEGEEQSQRPNTAKLQDLLWNYYNQDSVVLATE